MINVQCEVNAMQAGKQSYDVEHKAILKFKNRTQPIILLQFALTVLVNNHLETHR